MMAVEEELGPGLWGVVVAAAVAALGPRSGFLGVAMVEE